jgi:hypothetical protein
MCSRSHAPGAALCPARLGTAINSTCVRLGSKNGGKYTAIFLSDTKFRQYGLSVAIVKYTSPAFTGISGGGR